MFTITNRQYKNAERIGVIIAPTKRYGYNIDVFKRNKSGEYNKIAVIGKCGERVYEDMLYLELTGCLANGELPIVTGKHRDWETFVTGKHS